MRTLCAMLMVMTAVGLASAAEIVVQKVQGDVMVRQGMTESWIRVAVGDVLRPDDTMKTGSRSSATILVTGRGKDGSTKRIALPPEVIVDMSDVRELTPEELMLKLAMERIRSAPYEWKKNDLNIPNASVVHGTNKESDTAPAENSLLTGVLQINGTQVLFEHGFYSTCALKAMEIFRLYPPLGDRFENRLMVGEALERAQLKGEALNEYGVALRLPGVTAAQETLVRSRMAQLRK